jgi:protein-disulfide isomerase
MDSQNAQPAQHKDRTKAKVIALVITLVLLLALGYFAKSTFNYYQKIRTGTLDLSSFEQGGQTTITNTPQVTTIRNTAAENFADDPSIGPSTAKLTVIIFEDFECPFCQQMFPTIRSMITQHSDTVRFVYRDFPISERHPNAQKAAEAGQCAHEQGQFWSYHDKLFLNAGKLTVNDLKLYAQQLHLNTDVFDTCLDSGKYTQEVLADFSDGIEAGVTGTPTFFFNGNRLGGGISENGFEQIIDYFTN